MGDMAKRYKLETDDVGEFQLHITMGPTISDKFDLAEALQQAVDAVERGKKSGAITDASGTKVGEFGHV